MAKSVMLYDPERDLALATLGANDVILTTTNIDGGKDSGFFLKWCRWAGVMVGKTATEGPLVWGFACNMAADEIEQWMEADPQSRADPDLAVPIGWILPMGMVPIAPTAISLGGEGGNNSLHRFQKVNWSIIEGQAFSIWCLNLGAALTTGTIFTFNLQFSGSWLRD